MFYNGATLDEISEEFAALYEFTDAKSLPTRVFYTMIGVGAMIAFPYTAYRLIRGFVKVTRK